ncbi:MAG: DNA polymerase III subunit gamma/tau [Patescibacteria group bacterium]|nr:DNA polymerase III subunit gamma/tau [Patescibacteria group bacterium]MDD5121476.1 DNA polymerase III subunit gamma/tau [Patescibacteria group bacterium]MDD5221948.1 DNA polymerase III subunit gamma/tau [Patescibacteria group bacterium]MDD5396362.1 DNA polymerase III subunit gamma/tau [Patescibacteria group bacterium]
MVIYRKYRPQNFSEVIGQEHVIRTLENEIKQERLAHAYLLTGPRGLGKTTLARLVAKAVNCENRKKGESEPCNKCSNCLELMQGKFFDLIEMDAASQTGVDNVRENIIAGTRVPPSRGKYKIFIIDEVHMLSTAAFNALLKTLEEPPSYIIFILATTEIHKVPDTIISRCQRFDLTKVDLDKIVERLAKIAKSEKVKIESEVLKIIAQRSEGSVRDAESLLSQIFTFDDQEITMEEASLVIPSTKLNLIVNFVKLLASKDKKEAIGLINKLLEEGVDLEQFTKDLIEFLRKVLLVKVGADQERILQYLDNEVQEKVRDFANKFEQNALILMIEQFISVQQELSYAKIPQLPLELAVIKICS